MRILTRSLELLGNLLDRFPVLDRITEWCFDRVCSVIDPDFDVDWEKDEAHRLIESIPGKDK